MGRILGRKDAPAEALPADEEPTFPEDAGAETQNIAAVPAADGATQAVPRIDDSTQAAPRTAEEFGGRPMFRDEASSGGPGGHNATAEIDLTAMDGFDDDDDSRYRRRHGSGGGGGMGTGTKIAIGAGFAALVVLGGGGAFFIASNGGGAEAETAGGATVDPPAEAAALESGGLFPETLEVGGADYELILVDDTDDCATVARASYGEVLTENGCSQVIRATYADPDGAVAVTAGVAALESPEAAGAAIEAQDLGAGEWFAGLNGADGSGAEGIADAAGQGGGGQWGPYLLFAFAANADGTPPSEGGTDLESVGSGFVGTTLDSLAEQTG